MTHPRATFLPFSRPTIGDDEVAEVVDSLRSGWITSGPKVQRFEQMFKDRLGVGQAVALSSATAGLHVALAALDLGPEDEVIVPTLTWPATANVVELLGARTVFADVDAETLCMDPLDVARRVTRRTRAIVPVHFAGQPADLDALRALAREHDLALVQDAAHALGAAYRGVEVGAGLGPGECCVFSFHPIKNITTGEGGVVLLDDGPTADRLRRLRFHGVSRDAWKRYQRGGSARYDVLEPGWKYNMLDLQAALGLHQLRRLDELNARRALLAARYDRLLAEVPHTRALGRVPYPSKHAWHLYVIRLELEALTLDRDGVMSALQEENVGTGLHFPAVHLTSHYREVYGHAAGDLPRAEDACERILSLPLYPLLSEADQDDVVEALRRVLAAHRR